MRAHTQKAVSAKIFIEFIALIVRNRIYNLLKETMLRLERKRPFLRSAEEIGFSIAKGTETVIYCRVEQKEREAKPHERTAGIQEAEGQPDCGPGCGRGHGVLRGGGGNPEPGLVIHKGVP